jgi:response regulator RpfG family c-di-GMP phosphodiesterase
VDDEKEVLNSLERLFFDSDYSIHTFNSPLIALEKIPGIDPDIIVSDQMMPDMKGVDFLEKACELVPTSNFVMLTAYPEYGTVARALNSVNLCQFLSKPWDNDQLLNLIKKILLDRQREMIPGYDKMGAEADLEEIKKRVEFMKQQVRNRTQVILAENRKLLQSAKALEQNLWESIKIFFGLLEIKNKDIGEHSIRVSKLATWMGRKMGLSEREINNLEIASLLHDIGKIALPEYLLDRHGTGLSQDDQNLLSMHPLMGQYSFYNIETLRDIGNIIRCHHEKWNGTGFPDKLNTQEIPLEARILSICNKYDNYLYTTFKYLPNRKEKVLNTLITESGVAFDPNLVKLFVSFTKELDELSLMERDEENQYDYSPVKLLDIVIDQLVEEEERVRNNSVKISKEVEEVTNINCFPAKLKDMFYSLLKNSIEAIPAHGNIIVSMKTSKAYLEVSIKDDGIGIERTNLEKIFMPGFSTKDLKIHKGMGLTKFYEGLKAHQAKLELKSIPGKGTTFTFLIPLNIPQL